MNAVVHIYDQFTGRLMALTLLGDEHLNHCAWELGPFRAVGSVHQMVCAMEAEIELHRELALHGPLPFPSPRMN